jgi:CelD/BcsL family acetyltransferase involved in cellulose biosynthesis
VQENQRNPAPATVTLQSVSALQEFVPEWKDFLTTRADEHTFFQDPEVILAELEEHPHDYAPVVVVVRQNQDVDCIAHCYLHRSHFDLKLSVVRVARFRARLLRVFGDGFVFARGVDRDDCIRQVLRTLKHRCVPFSTIALQNVRIPSPIWSFFERPDSTSTGFALVRPSCEFATAHQLRLDSPYDEYLSRMTHNTRNNLRRRKDKLWTALNGQASFVRVREPEQVRGFLDQVEQLYARTWQCGTFGYFKRNSERDIGALERIARNGWLRGYLVIGSNGPVAFGRGYQYNGTYHLVELGYDQAWAQFAPGTVLTHLLVADLFREDPPAVLDFGFGDSQFKRVLGNHEQQATSAYLADSIRWRSTVALQGTLDRMETGIRQALVRSHIDQHVRRVLKHKQ